MLRFVICIAAVLVLRHPIQARTIHVPGDHSTIQAAIASASSGDTVVVASGRYFEHLELKPGISLRSEGTNDTGVERLQRAEATIIDGAHRVGEPGVRMAEGSSIDGFTITNVGRYDEAIWTKHFDSNGEELGDEEGSVQAEGTAPAVSVQGCTCTITNCIVHHNGDVGIGILGDVKSATTPVVVGNLVYRNMGGGIGVAEHAEAIVQRNTCRENLRAGIGCRKANPIIIDNRCFENIRAGIGCREGAKPLIRNNQCYRNRRAGIGIRMQGTAPVVEGNECWENEMAGIGCRDGTSPVLSNNVCYNNKMAGIGCRENAKPMIVGNECRHNELAGIGLEMMADALIHRNRCLDNKLVAIGVTGHSSATILDNQLSRNGGVPPIIAIKDNSVARIHNNAITGGGVAAVLVQGNATIEGNTFTGVGAKQGNAVWVWEQSTATITNNTFNGYRTAVHATKANITASGNRIRQFQKTAIIVKDSTMPAHIFGNIAFSADSKAQAVDLQGPSGIVRDNELKVE
ncbi:MAG: right-handed parallel beta-helix repeat-containing protein [Pirellulaceae bacterium]